MRPLPSLLLLTALAAPVAAQAPTSSATRQAEALRRIQAAALQDDKAYANLRHLCERIGHRLAGSKGLEAAVGWGQAVMKAEGLVNVRAEMTLVPHWERGPERAEVLAPARRALPVLGLGNGVSTPSGGLEGEVLAVGTPAALGQLPDAAVQGRIVLFTGPWTSYGPYSDARVRGAVAAARKGAVAMLLKAFAPKLHDQPHTGVLQYDPAVPAIPAAGVSVNDAARIEAELASGQAVKVRLDLQSKQHPDAESANVIGEIPGGGAPQEIVVVGGHLDSWDVGQCAQDDGVGCVLSRQAAELIQRLGLKPRRTIRVVWFTNEENGSRGGKAYLEAHRGALGRHLAAIESDIGNGLIQGFSVDLSGFKAASEARRGELLRAMQELRPFLEPLGAGRIDPGGSGVDVGPMVAAGVIGLGARHDLSKYWDVHHTAADTFATIDKQDLRKNLAILATALYLLADRPERP